MERLCVRSVNWLQLTILPLSTNGGFFFSGLLIFYGKKYVIWALRKVWTPQKDIIIKYLIRRCNCSSFLGVVEWVLKWRFQLSFWFFFVQMLALILIQFVHWWVQYPMSWDRMDILASLLRIAVLVFFDSVFTFLLFFLNPFFLGFLCCFFLLRLIFWFLYCNFILITYDIILKWCVTLLLEFT